jgi:lysozyme
MTISQGEADSFLLTDSEHASNAVMALVCDCHWNFNQFDAMVSLAFNIGSRAFRSSTVLRQHRAGNYLAAGDAFLMWDSLGLDSGMQYIHSLRFESR